MVYYVAYQQASTYPASVDRRLAQADMIGADRYAVPRSGVVPQADELSFKVTYTSGLGLKVEGGVAVVGDYRVLADAPWTLTVNAGGAAARTDLVVLRVYETEAGDQTNKAQVEIVQGTTTADPTVPARSIVLAAVAVAASAASINAGNITDRRTFTASAGGIVRIPGGYFNMGAAPFGSVGYDPVQDQFMFRSSSGSYGTQPLGIVMESGRTGGINGTSIAASGGYVDTVVPMNRAPYPWQPKVFCTIYGTTTGTYTMVPRPTLITQTQFTLKCINLGNAAATFSGMIVDWIVVNPNQ
jgi:hypothetical protein